MNIEDLIVSALEFIFKQIGMGIVALYMYLLVLMSNVIIACTMIATFMILGEVINYLDPYIQTYLPFPMHSIMIVLGFMLYVLYRVSAMVFNKSND